MSKVTMQSIKCCKLIRSLSCAISRQQTFMHSSSRVVTACHINVLRDPCWFHSTHLRTDVMGFSRKQQGYSLQHRRFKSSHTSEPNLSNGQATLASSEANGSERKDSTDELQALRDELQQMRDLGRSVPENISDADLEYIASLTSKNGKKKFLSFLFKREAIRKREKLQKLQRKLERGISEKMDDDEPLLPLNRLIRRISPVTILNSDNWRLASAMKFGPQVAYDFSFDDYMVRPEVIRMLSQLTHGMNANKAAKDPFYVHWTGLKEGSMTLREMKRTFSEHFRNLMVNVTETDVLEMFPRERLIYLTPDSRNIMHTFDVDKVYIVGGMVDSQTIQTGVTLAKAKRYNISHARLPLDLYLQWEMGAKTLTLDQVARILHTLHETGDWVKALGNVPTRKHGGFKVNRTIDSRVAEKIETRQDLEQYYQRKKQEMALGRARKESLVKDSNRFSFSRAKREFKWDLKSEFDQSERRRSESGDKRRTNVALDSEQDEEDDDPTGDTLFSPPSNLNRNLRRKAGRKGSKWFEG